MRVLSCFMRTAHNIAFSSEDDSALLTGLQTTQTFFCKRKFHPDGRIQFYNRIIRSNYSLTPSRRHTKYYTHIVL